MRAGLHTKLNILSVGWMGIVFFLLLFLSVYFTSQSARELNSELDERIAVLLNGLVTSSEFPILAGDRETLSRLAEGAAAQKDVVFCCIEDAHGIPIVKHGREDESATRAFIVPVVTTHHGRGEEEGLMLGAPEGIKEEIGRVHIAISLSGLRQKVSSVRNTAAVVSLVILLLVSLAGSLLLKTTLSDPISTLVRGTERIAGGDFEHRVRVGRNDEIGALAASFNTMTEKLSRTLVSKQYVDNIIESMIDSLIVTDLEGRIQTVNRATLDLLGYSQSELAGKSVASLFQEDQLGGLDIDELKSGPGISNAEKAYLSKDGRSIPVLFSASVIREEDTIRGIVCVAQDSTESKRAKEALQAANEELASAVGKLEEANRELKDLVYIASHDLREPLRKISSFGRLLSDSLGARLSADENENLYFMVDGADRMTKMIEGLLTYSRVSRDESPFEAVDLNQLVEQLRGIDLSGLIEDAGATVDVPDPLPRVMAHPAQLSRLMQNLIANGIKYCREGVSPRVLVRAERISCDRIRVEVEDNGIGIKEEHTESIFVMFKRLHPRNRYQGTGIGLAVCKKVVEKHGGHIGVESVVGGGSKFWFTISAANDPALVLQ
ncbi:MAG: ATP-binding protein [Candidatus Eisenbacteria bacterium]